MKRPGLIILYCLVLTISGCTLSTHHSSRLTSVLTAATNQGVWQYINNSWQEVGGSDSPLAQKEISQVISSPKGTLTTTTVGGIWQYEHNAWNKTYLSSFTSGWISSLAYSPKGLLTVGTSVGNVWQYGEKGWRQVGELPFRNSQVIYSLAYSPRGILTLGHLIPTYNIGISAMPGVWQYSHGHWREVGGSNSLGAHLYARSIAFSPTGILTIGGGTTGSSYNGVWQYSKGTWNRVGGNASPLARRIIEAITYSPNGVLTVATSGSHSTSVWTYNNGVWRMVGNMSQFTNNDIVSLAYSPAGTLFAGTDEKGVYQYKSGSWIEVGGPSSPLAQNGIMSLAFLPLAVNNA